MKAISRCCAAKQSYAPLQCMHAEALRPSFLLQVAPVERMVVTPDSHQDCVLKAMARQIDVRHDHVNSLLMCQQSRSQRAAPDNPLNLHAQALPWIAKFASTPLGNEAVRLSQLRVDLRDCDEKSFDQFSLQHSRTNTRCCSAARPCLSRWPDGTKLKCMHYQY